MLKEPYIIVNITLAAVIILIMTYSLVFSPDMNTYPVVCIHEKLTGEHCVSCGLSHSLSLILRGRINEAYDWNSNGIRIFLFLAGQLLMRVIFSSVYMKHPETRRELVAFDISGSTLMFLLAFMPFLIWIFRFS